MSMYVGPHQQMKEKLVFWFSQRLSAHLKRFGSIAASNSKQT